MKAFLISRMVSGLPGFNSLPYGGCVLCADTAIGGWGIYIVTGTPWQIADIIALPEVIGICAITAPDFDAWPELQEVINTTVRNAMNTWLTGHQNPTIPAGYTNRQAILAICKRLNAYYEIENTDVHDPS